MLHNQLKFFLQHGWGDLLGFPGLREISKHLKILCIAIQALLKGTTAAACSIDSLHAIPVKCFASHAVRLGSAPGWARLERALGSLTQWWLPGEGVEIRDL